LTTTAPARVAVWSTRHYRSVAAAILALALFNVSFRLGRESVGEWDESLYATTAWEMTRSGDLVGTTFGGALDYYNSKPPLNAWLIAGSFALFGVNLIALRLPSALFGWLTVWVLQRWTRRAFGPLVSLLASLVLATTFAFLHQHSARSGNPDALFALLVLLVIVVLSDSRDHPWRRVWLGPVLAAVFLLKGFAVFLPLIIVALVAVVEVTGPSTVRRSRPYATAMALFLMITGAWAVARYQIDRMAFFQHMIANDLLGVTLRQLDRHDTGPLFYFNVLQRYHYGWLLGAAIAAVWIRPLSRIWPAFRRAARDNKFLCTLLLAWGVATFVVPSLMQTRLIWYLNPFYPLFALVVALVVASGLTAAPTARSAAVLASVIVAIAVTAEGRSLWRLYRVTNLDRSVQGLLIAHAPRHERGRVFRDRLMRSEKFVVEAVIGTGFEVVEGLSAPPAEAKSGDVVVVAERARVLELRKLGSADGHAVYRVE
jgi:4-amino-4-deoxy-L-arabinose transferase-like glycosyltransferase